MKVHNIPSLNPLQLFRSPFQQQQQVQNRAGLRPESRGHIPKVPSLLFEIELEEVPSRVDVPDDSETQGILTNFRSLGVPWSRTEHELLAEWKATSSKDHGHSEALTTLASRLRSLGHLVSVRTALGGGWGGECLRNLRHSFLVCTVKSGSESTVYIIDPAFREQFEIAHATTRYQQILEAIPSTFVGTEERLVALVRALCQEIQGVFHEQNTTLPPWRDLAAQLSKWRPRHSLDCPILDDEAEVSHGHELNLVKSVSAGAGQLDHAASGKGSQGAKRAGLARTSAPIPLGPPAQGTTKGQQLLSSGSSRANLYQRMAVPVQQLVSRSCTQSGLLVSGL